MNEKREHGDPESEFLASRTSRMKEYPFLGGTGECGGVNDSESNRGDCYYSDENNRKRVDEFWTGFNEQRTICSRTITEMKEEAKKCGEGITMTDVRDRNDAKLVSWYLFCFVLQLS